MEQLIHGGSLWRNHVYAVFFIDENSNRRVDELRNHLERVKVRQLQEVLVQLVGCDSFEVHHSTHLPLAPELAELQPA